MPAGPSGVNNTPPPVSGEVAVGNSARQPLRKAHMADAGVSKTALAIWNKLSADLVANPSGNWNEALDNAQELARSVCGQDLPPDLQADLLKNFKLLEQTLIGLNISPSKNRPDPKTYIKDQFLAFNLNIVTDAKDLRKLESIRDSQSN